MRWRNLTTIALWATGSFVTTMALCLPPRLDANPPLSPDGALINVPKLKVDGAEVSLLMANAPAPGARPVVPAGSTLSLSLLARNTSDRSVELPVKITVLATPPVSPLSRVMPPPKEIWSCEKTIALGPNAEQKIALDFGKPLAGRSQVTVVLTSGQQTIQPLYLSVSPEPDANGQRL